MAQRLASVAPPDCYHHCRRPHQLNRSHRWRAPIQLHPPPLSSSPCFLAKRHPLRYGDEADKGIKTSDDAKHYGLSAVMPKFTQKKDLVVQYVVRVGVRVNLGLGAVMPKFTQKKDLVVQYVV